MCERSALAAKRTYPKPSSAQRKEKTALQESMEFSRKFGSIWVGGLQSEEISRAAEINSPRKKKSTQIRKRTESSVLPRRHKENLSKPRWQIHGSSLVLAGSPIGFWKDDSFLLSLNMDVFFQLGFGSVSHDAVRNWRLEGPTNDQHLIRTATLIFGDVANEVETEQIACDASIGASQPGHYTSFVQMRGSVPGYWSQDISKIQPKPPIFFETQDPFASTAGKHFNELLQRYGSPIVVVNLVKKREQRRHEVLLSEELSKQIHYLNQFLPTCHKFQYIHFDMARSNKAMDNIAYNYVKRTGFFHNRPTFYAQKIKAGKHQEVFQHAEEMRSPPIMQTGVIRTNCVDCLDRTNMAQFAVGHCALAFQLHVLGVLTEPHIEVDTDCMRMLEEMYGGSQLVNRAMDEKVMAKLGNNIRCLQLVTGTSIPAMLVVVLTTSTPPSILHSIPTYYSLLYGQSNAHEPKAILERFVGPRLQGYLVSTDGYMNLQLANTEEFITGSPGGILVRCNKVINIRVAD